MAQKLRKREIAILCVTAVMVSAIVICAIIFWKEFYSFFEMVVDGTGNLKSYILDMGFKAVVLLFVIIFALFFFPFLPSVLFQLAAGVAYGPLIATVIVGCAIGLASQVLYLFTKNIRILSRSPKKVKEREELQAKIANSGKSIVTVLFIAYFVPGIPFLLISTIGAVSGIKYWKYLLFTFFGPWLEIVFTVALGNTLTMVSPVGTMIMFGVILLLILLSLIYKKQIIDWCFKPKQSVEQIIRKRAHKPNKLLYALLAVFFRIHARFSPRIRLHNVDVIRRYKKPFVIISNHSSRRDFIYMALACCPRQLNFIVGHYELYDASTRPLLKTLGAIPKYLYQPDITALKDMMYIVKQGGNLAMLPEGIISITGKSKPINPSTGKLLKKLGIAVFALNIQGGYNSYPKYNFLSNKGRIDVDAKMLFDDQSIATATVDDIDVALRDAVRYDENDWIDREQVAFVPNKHGFAHRLETLLYSCPICGKEFCMNSDYDKLSCSHCRSGVRVNNYMQLESIDGHKPVPFGTIPQWWEYQSQQCEKQLDCASDKILIQDNCQLITLDKFSRKNKGKKVIGSGVVTLTMQQFKFVGQANGEDFEWCVSTDNLPSLGFSAGRYIESYFNDDFYRFELSRPIEAAKWTILTELIHKRRVGTWIR